jgi:hypothetical protein
VLHRDRAFHIGNSMLFMVQYTKPYPVRVKP